MSRRRVLGVLLAGGLLGLYVLVLTRGAVLT